MKRFLFHVNMYVACVLCFFGLCLVIPETDCTTMNDTKTLYDTLMADYNKYIRPIQNQSSCVMVNISLTTIALQEFDEVLERFSMVGVFNLYWVDENLRWNTSDYNGVSVIHMGYENVWVPEIIMTNPSDTLDSFGEDWQLIEYSNDGSSAWHPADLIKATCSMNVLYFPFDIQDCYIEVYVWGYTFDVVQLNPSLPYVYTAIMPEHSSWTLLGTSVEIKNEYGSAAVFSFRYQRKPLYVIITILLPILFLCLLNVLVFALPAEAGERIGFAITMLLAISVYMTIVSDTLPKTSNPMPIIAFFLLTCFIVSMAITLVTVLNLRIYFKSSESRVPETLERLYRLISKIKCGSGSESDKPDTSETKNNQVAPQLEDVENKKWKIMEQDQEHSGETKNVTWQDISLMVDFIASVVSVFILVLAFVVFIIVTTTSS